MLLKRGNQYKSVDPIPKESEEERIHSKKQGGIYVSKPQLPNILLILNDDMGFSDIGCYGGEIETPNLDRLAEKGIRFSQFYNTARCSPSRASLLTGLHPHQTGI